MATVVKSFAVEGIDGFMIDVEATVIKGAQQMISIIGLGDQAVKEAGERMQAAIEFCGYELPKDKVIISLAPGDKRKRGAHYDLPMTIALLIHTNQITAKNIEDYAFIGELSLNGLIRAGSGILPMVNSARINNVKNIIVPAGNYEEAKSVSGINVIGIQNLRDAVRFLEGKVPENELKTQQEHKKNDSKLDTQTSASLDFSDVKGQQELIDAIVLGAAGGHNILMIQQ